MEDEGYVLNPTKNDPQGMASAVTYARRNTLGANLGIVTEDDDDGNKASEPVKQAPKQAPVKTLEEPDWFTENGELNENGIKAAQSIASGMEWAKIEKYYLISKGTKQAVTDYIASTK
jgi:hypothetical protein